MSDKIIIEKGVPLYPRHTAKKYAASTANADYPFAELEIGDSFFVPSPPTTISDSLQHARRKFAGRIFQCRAVDGGCRVWRTA